MSTDNQKLIKEIVDLYFNLGQHISTESTKFKNKLDPNTGLDSPDLETLSEQIDVWINSLGIMSDKLNVVMTANNDSI